MQCVHAVSLFSRVGAIEGIGCVCYIGKLRNNLKVRIAYAKRLKRIWYCGHRYLHG